MGMFDLDKTLGHGVNLKERFDFKKEFIVWGLVEIHEQVEIPNTELPPADICVFLVSDYTTPDEKFEGSVMGSAITEKAKLADEKDFPAVVYLDQAESSIAGGNPALIMRFVREYEGAEAETLQE